MANAGDVKAQEKVAVAYLKGNGTEKDINKALEYFKMCAENGSGLGNYQLGKAYENGNGVEANMEQPLHTTKNPQNLVMQMLKMF